MSKKTLLVIPPEFREPLGPPPVLNTEDAKRYWALFGQFAELIRPSDFLEWMWVGDMTDERLGNKRLTRLRPL